jgi:hypothetical protein
MVRYGGSIHTLHERFCDSLSPWAPASQGMLSGEVLSARSRLVRLKSAFLPCEVFTSCHRLPKADLINIFKPSFVEKLLVKATSCNPISTTVTCVLVRLLS